MIDGNEDSLVLVHVLFRHGHRTANGAEELYPKDPHLNATYYPFGLGQLTNTGKKREYALGKTLRSRYDKFLGDHYYPEAVEARSTDYSRTKMSLELVLAGLFPPRGEEQWNTELGWQPIPFNYLPRSQDKVLQGTISAEYLELYLEQNKSEEQQEEFRKHQKVFDYISEHTGLNVGSFFDVYNLFFGISTEIEWGFELPKWAEDLWPGKITELAVQEYFAASATKELRTYAIGYFLRKVIDDTRAKIDGKAKEKKLFLYSGHENNIAHLLIALKIFKERHIPPYGAYVILEVHKFGETYAIKVFYENYTMNKIHLMELPRSKQGICKFDDFVSIVEDILPISPEAIE